MITTLHIKNIGIIDDLTIDFNKGLNVLTGETGAGKTLMIESLNMIAGGRFSKERIRKGEEYSYVEMGLFLPEKEEPNIIVSREIYTNGRNSCKINGRLVTVTELKEFMRPILDIHGQNDNQNLLNSQMHLSYLDDFAGEELLKIKEEYQLLYRQYQEIKQELKNNYGDEKEKQRKLDLLKYQASEIENANLKIGEEEEWEEKKRLLQNAEKITKNLAEADGEIGTNAIDAMNAAIKNFEKLASIGEKYERTLNSLKSTFYDLQEISFEISGMGKDIEFEEEDRNEIEERLDLLFSLKRKYGNTIEEILDYGKETQEEITKIENLEEYNKKLKEKISDLETKMYHLGIQMNQKRKLAAEKLVEGVNTELKELEMANATFAIKIQGGEDKKFHKNGLDEVEFLVATNIGEDEKPLIKIASGGEMSRIMLAIKTVLTDVDKVPVIVFDEIDTGISGKAANKVGEKLVKIAKRHQVLIVTHLASIAAKGEHNYYIHKEVKEGKTNTKIEKLNEEQTIAEIARIATGQINEISLQHAQALRR